MAMCEQVNNNTNKQQQPPTSPTTSTNSGNNNNNHKRYYTHNPYARTSPIKNNSNNATPTHQQEQQQKQELPLLLQRQPTPAEIELQRGLDSMLITPDAAQNFHDSNNTLHRDLIGSVSFAPYPTEAVEFDYAFYESAAHANDFTRVFIGQLPYRVTEMQLQWIFYVFGHGTQIHNPERITKKAKTVGNARVPTGCIHCHIRSDKIQGVLTCMHKRLLIDDSGIWYARSSQEQDLLEAYIQKLKKHPELRFPDRPYDTMVVQEAVSSYQSSQPRWVSNAPEAEKFAETTPSRKAQILYLQQQKMLKMQQQQQQYRPRHQSNNNNNNGSVTPSAASTSTILTNNNSTNSEYNSSTSSHPISVGECDLQQQQPHHHHNMPSFKQYQQQQQHSQQHQQQYYQQHQYHQQQPQQPTIQQPQHQYSLNNSSHNSSGSIYNNNDRFYYQN